MSNWKKLMEKYGISETNPPGSIKKALKDLNDIKKNIDKIDSKLNGSDISDERRQQLQSERNEWSETYEAQEEVVEETIEKYEKNKEMYAEKMRVMKEAVAKKKATESGAETAKEEVKDEPPAAPAGVIVETPAPKVETVKAEVIEDKPEKKGMSTGTKLILGGLFLVLSFGAYNYFIKKDE
jgi:cobalamin biosynthesis Mg chelatase CobN